MKRARVGRQSMLPKPKHYLRDRVKRIEATNHSSRPLVLGEFSSIGNQPGGGWATFIPPGESREVQLLLTQGGRPYEAMREWFIRREAVKTRRRMAFDLNTTARFWNLGPAPRLTKEKCGWLHLDGVRVVSWGPDIQRAIKVWEESDYRGLSPIDLLAYLEPDQYLPFVAWHPKPKIQAQSRWLHVAIDLARPIEEQFQEVQSLCKKLRDYSLLLAGLRVRRPGRREVRRNILAFTLRYSAGMTIRQVAKVLFPHEGESAEWKVKDILRSVRRSLDSELLRSQRHPPRRTK